MTKKKIALIIFEILFVLIASVYYVIYEVIPEYKTKLGSSDRFINSQRYVNMFEINIDNNIDFSFIIDKNKNIYHMMFFDKNAIILYNKNIENSNFIDGCNKSIKLLIENNYLKNSSSIKITRYDDVNYDEFLNSFKSVLARYNIYSTITEEASTIEDKAMEIGIGGKNTSELLTNMDMYSKQIKRSIPTDSDNSNLEFSKSSSKTLSNNVYKKIEKYVSSNNIDNLEKGNNDLVITMIPGDSSLRYFPSEESWYYVKDKKVYAYIEFIDDGEIYGYCYNGSIDEVLEGECV